MSQIDGETNVFQDKTKFKQYLATNPALQSILEENTSMHKIHARKHKKIIISQQTQKKKISHTHTHTH